MLSKEFKARFDAKWIRDESSDCWLWTASCAGQKDYGQMKIPKQRKQEYAHRIAYLIHKGEIPEGMQVCHRCDNPKCVNPSHLFLGTCAENHADMKAKGRHLYGEKNTQAKLNLEMVNQIHGMLKLNIPQWKIARAFGVSQITISRIKRHLRWQHVKT